MERSGDIDVLVLLAYKWTVVAEDEEEAIYAAVERATRIPRWTLAGRLRVERLGYGVYRLVNTGKGSSIIVRVSEDPGLVEYTSAHPALYPIIQQIYNAPAWGRRFIVVFDPRTYRRG